MDRDDYYPNFDIRPEVGVQVPSHFECHRYSGFEPSQAFDIVYGGHFEHRLLSPHKATMEHQRLTVSEVRIESGAYDFPVIALGAMPPDSVCIGFVAEGAEITRYNTQEIGEDEIQIYGSSAELMYHAAGASSWINFTAPQDVLQRVAHERTGRPLRLPRREVVSAQLSRGARNHLRQLAGDAFSLAAALQPSGIGEALARELSRAFIAAYVDALSTAEEHAQPSRTATARRHYHLILACERLALRSGLLDIDLADIARKSGYSLRSLERIFRSSVGMPPDRYFMNMRLNGALRDLLAAGPTCTVTEVATRWGFKHLSRFAEYYRRAFGELPSRTLSRAASTSR